MAVGAVADEGFDQTGALGWLGACQLRMRRRSDGGKRGWAWLVGCRGTLMTDENETAGLTNASCTAPQKHVAVASSSVDQPSLARPANGKSFG